MKPSDELDNLLAELDAEFGKKPKAPKRGAPSASTSDKLRALYSAKAQLERTEFTNIAEWEMHRQMLEANELAKQLDWQPAWVPVARLTYIVRQHCMSCGDEVEFIGGEYIRFTSTRAKATITRRAEVCPDLFHFGFKGEPLPDLVDEIYQQVPRCPGCIKLEQKALEIWNALEGERQLHLPGIEPAAGLPPEPELKPARHQSMTGAELRQLVRRQIGSSPRNLSDELDIEL